MFVGSWLVMVFLTLAHHLTVEGTSYNGLSFPCKALGVDSPCQNGGACIVHVPRGVKCHCLPAWKGGTCELERNRCEDGSASCGPGWSCARNSSNLAAGYDCGCRARSGWRRLSEARPACVDIDECALLLPACHHGGTCTNRAGSFSCACRPGFSGARCEVVALPSRSADGWQPWSAWTGCGGRCRGGLQSRTRICRRRAGCDGEAEQRRPCRNSARCDADAWADDGAGYEDEDEDEDEWLVGGRRQRGGLAELRDEGWRRQARRADPPAPRWKLIHYLGFEPVRRRRRSLAQIEAYDDFELQLMNGGAREPQRVQRDQRYRGGVRRAMRSRPSQRGDVILL